MAKNIKWIKVDSVTGVSEATTKPKNGAVNPNLSGLNEPLRSHGGLHEREVPFIVNIKMKEINSVNQLYNYGCGEFKFRFVFLGIFVEAIINN